MCPPISVIVPTYNGLPHLKACLSAIEAAGERYGGQVEVIVVDNGSSDGTLEVAEAMTGADGRVIHTEAPTVSGVRNTGARRASGDVLAFIDSDTVIEANYFERAVEVLSDIGACATGAMVAVERSEGRIPYAWYNLQRHPSSGPVEYLNSANFTVQRSAFCDVGGFDESLRSGEDADICLRLREHGCTIYECLDLTPLHVDNPSSLRGFVKQQIWHGLGMFATVRLRSIDKPVAATLAYGLSAVLSVAGAAWLDIGVVLAFLAVATTTTLVAVTAATFRCWKARRVILPLTTIGLYHIYFISRWVALALLLAGARDPRRSNEPGGRSPPPGREA